MYPSCFCVRRLLKKKVRPDTSSSLPVASSEVGSSQYTSVAQLLQFGFALTSRTREIFCGTARIHMSPGTQLADGVSLMMLWI